MSMSPVSYRNVLNRAWDVLNQVKSNAQETNKKGLKKVVYFLNEVTDAIIECSEEIGRLEIFIKEHKTPHEFELVKLELEEVRQELRGTLNI